MFEPAWRYLEYSGLVVFINVSPLSHDHDRQRVAEENIVSEKENKCLS